MTSTPSPRHPSRKPIRLPSEAYREAGSAWLVTIGTEGRVPVFADPVLATGVVALLRERCAALGSDLDAFCLMPNHAHLLVRVSPTSLVDVVREFKSRSTQLW